MILWCWFTEVYAKFYLSPQVGHIYANKQFTFIRIIGLCARDSEGDCCESRYSFLFLALFGGMAISAWQKGMIRLRWRFARSWPRQLIGGAFMGAGATMIQGGNDTLLLESIPGLSPHAVPAFVALLCGIGVTLLILRKFTGKIAKVVCTNDKFQDKE